MFWVPMDECSIDSHFNFKYLCCQYPQPVFADIFFCPMTLGHILHYASLNLTFHVCPFLIVTLSPIAGENILEMYSPLPCLPQESEVA